MTWGYQGRNFFSRLETAASVIMSELQTQLCREARLLWKTTGPSSAVDDDGGVVYDYEAETPEGTYTLRALDDIFTRRFIGYLINFTDRNGRVSHLTERIRIRNPKRAKEIAAADYRQRMRDGRVKRARSRSRRAIAAREKLAA
jgi:hypothetical protein